MTNYPTVEITTPQARSLGEVEITTTESDSSMESRWIELESDTVDGFSRIEVAEFAHKDEDGKVKNVSRNVTMHGVQSVKVGKFQKLDSGTRTKDIEITDAYGNTLTIQIFMK